LELIDFTRDLHDFADTAAMIANLDLVISIDTSVAHLAAAMGKPVWVLVPFAPDWRWLLAGDDSPWYPSMRLFRQNRPNDWSDVIGEVTQQLRRIAQSE
jgi:ADP-heptose:LPS heptosyltransferase